MARGFLTGQFTNESVRGQQKPTEKNGQNYVGRLAHTVSTCTGQGKVAAVVSSLKNAPFPGTGDSFRGRFIDDMMFRTKSNQQKEDISDVLTLRKNALRP